MFDFLNLSSFNTTFFVVLLCIYAVILTVTQIFLKRFITFVFKQSFKTAMALSIVSGIVWITLFICSFWATAAVFAIGFPIEVALATYRRKMVINIVTEQFCV